MDSQCFFNVFARMKNALPKNLVLRMQMQGIPSFKKPCIKYKVIV